MATITDRVSFKARDGKSIAGRLDRPLGPIRCFALYAHCFTCTKDILSATRICRFLAENGIATLRFDFRGLGDSEGDFSQTTFTDNVEDILSAYDFMQREYKIPEILIGHSLGGTTALVAASKLKEIKAVVTINSPCHPIHVKRHFVDVEDEILWSGAGDVMIQGRPFKLQREFFDDLEKQDMKEVFKNLDAALLVLHSPNDETVNVKNANYIFSMARHPKSFIALDGVDHLITKEPDARYVAQVIHAWASRYALLYNDKKMPNIEGQVMVLESGEGKFREEIYMGVHKMIADEPPSVEGGQGSGPSPYDILLASLGACTAMTMRMYADYKKLPAYHARVNLTHRKIHGEDCADCEHKEGRIDIIDREIVLEGDLSAAQRQSLLEIAEKCPIHRTLLGEVKIKSYLKS